MPRPRRKILVTAQETGTPPDVLEPGHVLTKVIKSEGKNLYTVSTPTGKSLLVELPARFRSTIWIKRGGYLLVDTTAFEERDNKLGGEIENVVREEKLWRKMPYWPAEFVKSNAYVEDSDEEESNVGKMPPEAESDSES